MHKRIWFSIGFAIWMLLSLLAPGTTTSAQSEQPLVLVLQANGPLTPVMREYLQRGIQTAENRGAEALIFELDTPGGDISLMTDIIRLIRSSTVPVIVYVYPRGGMAASAGTLITFAGHAAAMAPETTIGAASPVGGAGEDLGETIQSKIKNDMKAIVRSMPQHRSEQAIQFVERAIDEAEAASAQEAVDLGVVDFISRDVSELLQQLDGFRVETASGEKILNTRNAIVEQLNQTIIERLLNTLTNPNIVFLLLAVGVQAILIEISSPGGWIAGFIGVVCLALAVYGMGVLPVNYFGLIFLVVAFVLFILDIKAPTHGALTAAGVATLIVGALVLFNTPGVPSFQRVSVPLVIATSLMTGVLFFIVLLFALRAQKVPIRVGSERLTGRTGIVKVDLDPVGIVQLAGEQWTAEVVNGGESLPTGTRVEVVRVAGLKLIVRKA